MDEMCNSKRRRKSERGCERASTCVNACGFKRKMPMAPLTTVRHGWCDLPVSYQQEKHAKYTGHRGNCPSATSPH